MHTIGQGANTQVRVRLALRLEAITIAWMVVEATVSIGAGVLARSILLVAFGAGSGVELLSACKLYWRLHHEARARPEDEAAMERIERRLRRAPGILSLWHKG